MFFIHLLCQQLTPSTSSFSFIMSSNLWKTSFFIFFHFSLLLYALIVVIFLPFCHALEEFGFDFFAIEPNLCTAKFSFYDFDKCFFTFSSDKQQILDRLLFQPSCSLLFQSCFEICCFCFFPTLFAVERSIMFSPMQVFLNIWHHCNQLSTFFRLTLLDRLHYLQNSSGIFPVTPEL